jgi:hypothetical protein
MVNYFEDFESFYIHLQYFILLFLYIQGLFHNLFFESN